MGNYVESKNKIDAIRSKYNCAGDVIFKTATQYIVEHGQYNFRDETWFDECINDVDERHDLAERNGKWLFMTRSFEKALLECARDLAFVEPYDLLVYIQKEIYLGGDGISYQRAMQIIRDCLCYTADCYGSYRLDEEETLGKFRNIGLSDEEIEYFGWKELLEAEEECEDDY